MNKEELSNYLIKENNEFNEEEFFSHDNRRALIFISPNEMFKLNVPVNSSHTEMIEKIYNLVFDDELPSNISYMDLREKTLPNKNIIVINLTSTGYSELILPNKVNESQLEKIIEEAEILKEYNKFGYLYYDSNESTIHKNLNDGIKYLMNKVEDIKLKENILERKSMKK